MEHRIPISNNVFPGGYGVDILILDRVWLYHYETYGPVQNICTIHTFLCNMFNAMEM